MTEAERLADEHWTWMQNFVGSWMIQWLKLVELNYKEGFKHGYKHGQEEKK